MALLAVVDSLEHAIFTATSANSMADATRTNRRQTGKNQPITSALSIKRVKKKKKVFWKHELPVKLTAMSGVVDAAPESEKKVGGGQEVKVKAEG